MKNVNVRHLEVGIKRKLARAAFSCHVLLSDKFHIRKDGIFNMSRAWDKEKI